MNPTVLNGRDHLPPRPLLNNLFVTALGVHGTDENDLGRSFQNLFHSPSGVHFPFFRGNVLASCERDQIVRKASPPNRHDGGFSNLHEDPRSRETPCEINDFLPPTLHVL